MKIYIKKILILSLILICAIALCVSFTACSVENEGSKTITLVIGEGDTATVFEDYKTNAEYLVDVLNELKAEEKITYTSTESTYGAYLTEINGLCEASNIYIAILTTITEQQDVTTYAVKREYNDIEYISSISGVTSLPIIDGAGYLIALDIF